MPQTKREKRMASRYRNHNSRSEALKQLEQGQSILLVPYREGAYKQEATSITAASVRLGIKVELKSVLVSVEGEVSERVLRVTRID